MGGGAWGGRVGALGGRDSPAGALLSPTPRRAPLPPAQVAKDYPNDDIELISVERQIVSGTNWHIQVEVQTLSPVIYTAVVYQALPADGGNFTITSISSQSF